MCSLYDKELYIRDKLPTVDNFYNVYHPSDLVAYRVEPLIKPHPQPVDLEKTELNLMKDNSQSEEEQDVPPPVLIPCYWNKGMNYSQ